MNLPNLKIAEIVRWRLSLMTAILLVAGFAFAPAYAVADSSDKPLTKAPKTVPTSKDARVQWNKKWGPLVPHKTFPKKCDLCHVAKRWDVMRPDFHFDHKKETGYALEGAHATAACLRCHNDRVVAKVYVARGCSGCHQDPHQAKLGLDCKRCHSEINWKPMETALGQHARTRFPLTGLHATVLCIQCHPRSQTGDFAGAPVDCYSCHQADYTKAPNHVAMNFAHTCQDCHNTTAFTDALFDHSKLGANLICDSCHQADYQAAQNPNHVAAGFPTTCQSCHTTASWLIGGAGTFNHASTGFALVGMHATISCSQCHVNNNYNLQTADCLSCHQADFTLASQPGANVVHGATPYVASACASCHGDATTWANATAFDHAAIGFPLTGAHNTACANCHSLPGVTLSGNTLTVTCLSCHQSVDTGHGSYNSTSPSHALMGWPATAAACQQCHGDLTSWTNGPANAAPIHSSFAGGFALAGQHNDTGKTNGGGVIASCDGCHTNSNANISGTSCVPCHNADYATASAPGASPTQHDPTNNPASSCASCHGDFTSWTNGTGFNHAAIGFPLTGAHNTACANCHSLPGVTLSGNTLTVTCLSCHQSVDTGHGSYNSTSPSHASMGWPATAAACQQCHGDLTSWTNGPANAAPIHSSFAGGFALAGAHNDSGKVNAGNVVATCDGCHANSNSYISGTSCIPCHQQDYANASLPTATPVVHDPTGYPSANCASCHGDFSSWLNGVAFNHTAVGFPLTGLHNTACANCHNAALGQSHTGHACAMCHENYDTGHGDFVNATTPIDHDMKNGGTYALPLTCDNCHSYASAWTTTITPHPAGTCSGTPGSTTPWNHQGTTACSDCHTTVTSMAVADGTFNCGLCHRRQHPSAPGVCARGD